MPQYPSLDLLLLTGAAGVMDALSYLHSGVFTANMTGNTVVLGLGLAGVNASRVPLCAAALGGFAIGALIGALVLVRPHGSLNSRNDIKIGLTLELPFVLAFTLMSAVVPAPSSSTTAMPPILTAACALGIQSVAVRNLDISGVATTFITGTITMAMIFVASRGKGDVARKGRNSAALLAGIFVFYVLSAAAGAKLAHQHEILSTAVPLVLITVVLIRAMMPKPHAH